MGAEENSHRPAFVGAVAISSTFRALSSIRVLIKQKLEQKKGKKEILDPNTSGSVIFEAACVRLEFRRIYDAVVDY